MRNQIRSTKVQISIKPVLILALGLFGSIEARAQTGGLESQRVALTQMGQAVSRVVVKAKKVNERLGYGFYEGGCVFGVKLRPGSSASESFSLQAGQSYVFIGSGDKTARNVDIVLRDASGRVVCQDIEADAAPFILFRPNASGRYTMSLALKSGWKGPAFCAVTILRKGGTPLPLERIVQAAIRLDFASWDTFRAAKGGRIDEALGTWSLYGSVLRQGQALSTAPKRTGAVNRGVVAVGDGSVRDLDLVLLDGSRKIIARDTKNGAAPKITQKVNAGTYSVRVSNRSSSGPALVMAVLLDLPAQESPVPQPTPPATEATPTPTPLPSSEAPQELSFEGDWKGEWADEKKGRDGTFRMRVKRDGSVSGRLSLPSLRVAAKFKGTVAPDGTLRLNYSQFKQDSLAEGTLRFTDEGHQKAEARVSFSTDGTIFGNAELFLEKQN